MLTLILYVLVFFQDVPQPGANTVLDPDALMEQAKAQFLRGEYQATVDSLVPLVDQFHGEAMQLSADALFGLQTPGALRQARILYERCIYEDDNIPFVDHSYFQAATIYLLDAEGAKDASRVDLAAEAREEATFYLNQLIKKHPNSIYRDRALGLLLDLAIGTGNYGRIVTRAEAIWDLSTDPDLLQRVEPIAFIRQDPFTATPSQILENYTRHQEMIHRVPELLNHFAERLEERGDLANAAELFLLNANLWPNRDDGAQALLQLAQLYARQGKFTEAGFLFGRIMVAFPGDPVEFYAAAGAARLLESGAIRSLTIRQGPPGEEPTLVAEFSYRELLESITASYIDDPLRAEFTYKLSLFEAGSGNTARALLLMRQLLEDYDRGPFIGLYNAFYRNLLYAAVERAHSAGNYWALDRYYREHRQLLAFTTDTRYSQLVADAYLALNLPASAVQVYENMWTYKASIEGFDLAFEAPFTASLELLNIMRQESLLAARLADYASLYTENGRYADRYRLVKTLLDSRTMAAGEFLEAVREDLDNPASVTDARRLRRIAVIAQEEEDGALAEDIYRRLLQWPDVENQIPDLAREAELFLVDRLFLLGNYHGAEEAYRKVLADDRFKPTDRDWAFLQLARLHELRGEQKPALRIYGQVAYAPDQTSEPFGVYATRRLGAMAAAREMEDLEKELRLGEF